MDGLRDCDATHPKIGQIATLSTIAHQVSGPAVIVDDCTVRVDDFVYDGAGVDVRFYGGLGGEYETRRGFSTGVIVDPPGLAGYVYPLHAYASRIGGGIGAAIVGGDHELMPDRLRPLGHPRCP